MSLRNKLKKYYYWKLRLWNLKIMEINKRYLPYLHFSHPYYLSIELSTICNLHCILCPVGLGCLNRPVKFMSFDIFKKVINQINPKFIFSISPNMWGESMLHPQFVEMMEYIQSKKSFYEIDICTNGNIGLEGIDLKRLMRCGLHRITFAIDGYDQDNYASYRRNGNFEKLFNFIKAIKEERDKYSQKTKLNGVIILSRFNENNIDKIKNIFSPYLDFIGYRKMKLFVDYEDRERFISRYKEIQPLNPEFRYNPPSETRHAICEALFHGIYVNVDGDVIGCCGDPNNRYKFGNVAEKSILEIRKSKQYRNFHRRVISNPQSLPQCKSCLFEF